MSLHYAKDATVKKFAGLNEQVFSGGFANEKSVPASVQIDAINTMANNCREWYKPVFANESKYLPVSQKPELVVESGLVAVAQVAPPPPMKKEDNTLVNALLIGVGIFVVYKILS